MPKHKAKTPITHRNTLNKKKVNDPPSMICCVTNHLIAMPPKEINSTESTNDDKHKDGETALHKPAFQSQPFGRDKIGIHITEAIEDCHNATGTEDQTQNNTDG